MERKSKNTERILTGLIILAYTGMFLPMSVGNILLGLLLVFCLYCVKPSEILSTVKSSALVKTMLVMYLLLVAGMLYTTNMKVGVFVLEKKLALLLIPLFLMPCLQRMTMPLNVVIKGLGYVTLASSLLMLVIAVIRKYMMDDEKAFYFENVTPIHYVYYSIYFGCCSLLLINEIFDELYSRKNGFMVLILIYLYCLGILILTASKTGMIMFGVASIYLLYKKITNKRIFAITVVLLVLSACTLLYINETTLNRFKYLTENLSILFKDEVKHGEVFTDLNMRLLFWKISVTHAVQDHLWAFGTGTGDCQDYINSLYNLPQYELFGYINWDSHNQFVYTFLQLGLAGVFTLGFLLTYYLLKGLHQYDAALISFLIITGGFMLSESILESNKGIVFFALVFTILASRIDLKQKVEKVNPPSEA